MTIKNREEQGLHSTATREDMGGVWRTESIDERCHIELAYHPEHQWQMGHGIDRLNRNRHEAPLLQVLLEVASIHFLQSCKLADRVLEKHPASAATPRVW